MELGFESGQSPEPKDPKSSLQLDQDCIDMRTSMERIEELLYFGQNLLYGEENNVAIAIPTASHDNSGKAPSSRLKGRQRERTTSNTRMSRASQQSYRQQQQQPLQKQRVLRDYQSGDGVQHSKRSHRIPSQMNSSDSHDARLALPQRPKPLRKRMKENNEGEKEDLTLEQLQQRVRDELAQYRSRLEAKRKLKPIEYHSQYRQQRMVHLPSKHQGAMGTSPTQHYNDNRVASTASPKSRRNSYPHRSIRPRSVGPVFERASRTPNRISTVPKAHTFSASNVSLDVGGVKQRERIPAWRRLYEIAEVSSEKRRRVADVRREEAEQRALRKIHSRQISTLPQRFTTPNANSASSQMEHPQQGNSQSLSTSITHVGSRSTASNSLMGNGQKTLGDEVPQGAIAYRGTNSDKQQTRDDRNTPPPHSNGQGLNPKISTVSENGFYNGLDEVKQAISEEAVHIKDQGELQDPKQEARIRTAQHKTDSAGGEEVMKTELSGDLLEGILTSKNQDSRYGSKSSSPHGTDCGAEQEASSEGSWPFHVNSSTTLPPGVAPLDLRALRK